MCEQSVREAAPTTDGPNGSTLKAIEMLTGCYVLVQKTRCLHGQVEGLKTVRKIIEDARNMPITTSRS